MASVDVWPVRFLLRNYGTTINPSAYTGSPPEITVCEPMQCRFRNDGGGAADRPASGAPDPGVENNRDYIVKPGIEHDVSDCSPNSYMRTSRNAEQSLAATLKDTCQIKCAQGYDSATTPSTQMRCIFRAEILAASSTENKGIFYIDPPSPGAAPTPLITCNPRSCVIPNVLVNPTMWSPTEKTLVM